jgi:nitroimidazol reductase NimA-like FMN-containing flavoprotein (pyridoxamine 5'-phosphate oxidase superfamily)
MAKEIDSVEFTKRELSFLKEQRLGRIATFSSHGQPHVVPVAFEFRWHLLLLWRTETQEQSKVQKYTTK